MGIMLTCYNPATGQTTSFDANTVSSGGSGIGESTITDMVAFGAQRINLSMSDVQRTIQEGRAAGITPFSLYNSASPWESGQ